MVNIGPHARIVERVKDELGPWDVLKELRRPGSLVPGVRTALLFSEARKNLRCGFLEDRQCEKRYNSWVNYDPGNVVQPKTRKQSWAAHRTQHMSAEDAQAIDEKMSVLLAENEDGDNGQMLTDAQAQLLALQVKYFEIRRIPAVF